MHIVTSFMILDLIKFEDGTIVGMVRIWWSGSCGVIRSVIVRVKSLKHDGSLLEPPH